MVLSHFVGLGLHGGLSLANLSPLPLGAACALVLVLVAAWDTWSLEGALRSDAGERAAAS
jgi:hypothetical protein